MYEIFFNKYITITGKAYTLPSVDLAVK